MLSSESLDAVIAQFTAANDAFEKAEAARCSVRDALLAGETTGNAVREWAFVNFGAGCKEQEDILAPLHAYLAKRAGELVVLESQFGDPGVLGDHSKYVSVGVLGSHGLATHSFGWPQKVGLSIPASRSVFVDLIFVPLSDVYDPPRCTWGHRLVSGSYARSQGYPQITTGQGIGVINNISDIPRNMRRDKKGSFLYERTPITNPRLPGETPTTRTHHQRILAGTAPVIAHLKKNYWDNGNNIPDAAQQFFGPYRCSDAPVSSPLP